MKRSVIKPLSKAEAESILLGPGLGRDFSAIEFREGEAAVLSVCPVTRTRTEIAFCGVMEAVNNIACSGARPAGILATVLMPTTAAEQELRQLMKELDQAAALAGVSVAGGHTEVSRRVKEPLIVLTAVGAVLKEEMMTPGSARAGMELVLSKAVGLQGTAILAKEREEELRSRFTQPFLDKAQAFIRELPILPEIRAVREIGDRQDAVLHDLSEGGIFGALWELGQSSGVGMEVELHKIPIRQETVEICEFFDINPYKLIAGGSLLLAVENGTAAVRAMEQAGIPAAVIGRLTEGNDRVVVNDGERRFLETTQTDELYKVIP